MENNVTKAASHSELRMCRRSGGGGEVGAGMIELLLQRLGGNAQKCNTEKPRHILVTWAAKKTYIESNVSFLKTFFFFFYLFFSLTVKTSQRPWPSASPLHLVAPLLAG